MKATDVLSPTLGIRRHRPSGATGVIASMVALLFAGTMLTVIVAIGIWPGEIKLVAPLFCTDAQPDPFVVADSYSPQPGETVTNFTLYCMGPRGDATDHGFAGPFVATIAMNTVFIVLLVGAANLLRRLRRRTRASTSPETAPPAAPPGSTAGPFVD